MERYTIVCSCGHMVETTLYVPFEEQNQKTVRFHRAVLCPDCYKLRRVAVTTENPHTDHPNLIPLCGSEYQIAWAQDIRSQHISQFSKEIADLPNETRKILMQIMTELVNRIDKAGWWIDNQYNPYGPFIRMLTDSSQAVLLEVISHQILNSIRKSRRSRKRIPTNWVQAE